MTVFTLQANMTRGEISPYLHGRVDTEHYAAGLETARNVVALRFGGVTRAPGTRYGGRVKPGPPARFIPFAFNADQVYAIEAGSGYFRFWIPTADGGAQQIFSGASPVEIATPYSDTALPFLKLRQSADAIYIVCKGVKPQVLKRLSDTSWTLTPYDTLDGPFMPVNTTPTTLVLNGTADLGGITFPYDAASSNTGTLTFNVAGVVDAYWLQATSQKDPASTPVSWKLIGNSASGPVVLDQRAAEGGWSRGETRFFEFENTNAYSSYTFDWSGTSASPDTPKTAIGNMGLHVSAKTHGAITLSATSTQGINDGFGFLPSDVGRTVRFLPGDGRWRWLEIVSYIAPQNVEVKVHGHSLPDLSPSSSWRMGSWSEYSGWPSAIAIYEDRLVMGGAPSDPIGGSASASADYDNFRVSQPLLDDDAITFRLTGGELNEIRWLLEGRDLVAGTAGSIRAVGRNDAGKAFAPGNIRQRNETSVSASIADPVAIETMILFLDAGEQRLYEASYTYETEGYVARELSTLNEHLLQAGIKEIAYQSTPHRILWGRRGDGLLVAFTYDRDQKVFGATIVDVGGAVESVMALQNARETVLFMIVRRDFPSGAVIRSVETLAPFYRAWENASSPVYAAGALTYDGVATDAVSGLDHLEGFSVGIWADGVDAGDATVLGGAVTLPSGVSASKIVIGLRMPWSIKTLRLSQIGNQDGSGLGRAVNIVDAYIDLHEAAGVEVSAAGDTYPLRTVEDTEQDPFAARSLLTGMFPMTVDDSWRNNGQIVIGGDRMYPATVRAVSLKIDGEP